MQLPCPSKERATKGRFLLKSFSYLSKTYTWENHLRIKALLYFYVAGQSLLLEDCSRSPKGLITTIKAKLMGEESNCKCSIKDICLEGQNVLPYNVSSFLKPQHVWYRTQVILWTLLSVLIAWFMHTHTYSTTTSQSTRLQLSPPHCI